MFFALTTFTTPQVTYRVDLTNTSAYDLQLVRRANISASFDPVTSIHVEQVFYPSKDGTKIPMYIMYDKVLCVEIRRRSTTAVDRGERQ
jgi:prolyl oligopeptidase